MTITALDARDEYTANASQTIFNYTFKIYASSELDVYITPSGQSADDSTDLTTAYTVDPSTIGDPSGGFITLDAGTSAGDLVTIVSGLPYNRTVDYQNSGDFLPDTVDGDNDRQVSQIKQVKDLANRSLLVPNALQNASSLDLPLPSSGLFLRWKTDLTGLENTGAPGVTTPSQSFGVLVDMTADTSLSIGDLVITSGYYVAGDGGGATYLIAATQAVDGYGDHALASGTVALLQSNGTIDIKQYGAKGDGTTDDTAAIQAALDTTSTEIVFPDGTYRLANATTSPALTSSVADRRIFGSGIITATDQVKKALQVTGANTVIDGLHIDGNNFIGYAIEMAALNPTVRDCYIHDLNGFTDWGGIAIRLDFDGLDTTALVCNNVIKNLQGVGDATGGNGVGMQRAIAHETDQDCTAQILITGNVIEDVMGEEGDSIVIAGGTTADTKFVPAVISNNTINGWTRRGIKVAANGVTIAGNFMTNPLLATLPSLQRAIDCTSASNLVIKDNVLKECRFQLQIAIYLNVPQVGNDIVVSGNVIEGTGATGASGLIAIRTYGTDVVVEGNTIDWPDHGTRAIEVQETAGVRVMSNIVDVGAATWSLFTNSTDVRLGNNFNQDGGDFLSFYDPTGSLVIDTTEGNREILLDNTDSILSDAETIAKISSKQNDGSTDAIYSSIRFVAEGSSGNTAVAFHTGSAGTPDTEKARVSNSGRFIPGADNTYPLGWTTDRWASAFVETLRPGVGTSLWTSGAGSPEGSKTAPVGSMYTDTSGGAGTTLYIKESGTGNTGWVAK